MDAVQTETAGRRGVVLDPDRDDIDIKQHGQIGRDDLQELLEAGGCQDRDRRLVRAALAGQIASARGKQRAVLERDPRQLAAQPLDLEMLEILHPLAQPARRTAQQAQRLGMEGQKSGCRRR